MYKILILFFFLHLFTNLAAQDSLNRDWFSVKAFLPNHKLSSIKLTIDDKEVVSQTLESDIFSYNGKISGTQTGVLEVRKEKKVKFISFFIEGGTIRIRDAGNHLVAFDSPTNDAYNQLSSTIDSLAAFKASSTLADIVHYKRSLAVDFIEKNPASPVSLQLLKEYFFMEPAADDILYHKLFAALEPSLQQSFIGRKIAKEVVVRYRSAVGVPAPLVSFMNLDKQQHQLFEKEKLTLIDFWASWCVPCRKENKSWVALFKKYDSHNFNIISISLDTDEVQWKKAINQDQLTWKQLNDLKGWNGEAVEAFGIKLLPTNFLINGEGLIIAKNITAEELEDHLKQVQKHHKFKFFHL